MSSSRPDPGRARELLAWLEGPARAGTEMRPLGRGYQAAADLCTTPYGDIVVKQPRGAGLGRALGRLAIRHEYRAYRRLDGVPGIPHAYGLLGGDTLVLEHVAGRSLRAGETGLADRERFFAGMLETLHAMHAAGVAHGDLKRKDNILIGPGERAYLIDFGVACVRREDRGWRSSWNARLFAWLSQADYNAWAKLKCRRRLDELSAADAELYRPLVIERLARTIRIPYQKLTLRRLRKRRRLGR